MVVRLSDTGLDMRSITRNATRQKRRSITTDASSRKRRKGIFFVFIGRSLIYVDD